MSLLSGVRGRVYPVGRLDYASEGLLLLTNDGSLAQKLMKAASHVPKTYLVKISGKPAEADLAKLRSGVSIPSSDGKRRVRTAPAKIEIIKEEFIRILVGMYHNRIDYPTASGGITSEFASV